jgi:hypothetical protein
MSATTSDPERPSMPPLPTHGHQLKVKLREEWRIFVGGVEILARELDRFVTSAVETLRRRRPPQPTS